MSKLNLLADYEPHAYQKKMQDSKARFITVAAGARSGKTYGAGKKVLTRIIEDMFYKDSPLLFYWAVAPTTSLVKIALREIASTLAGYRCLEPSSNMVLVDSWNRTEKRLILFNGRVIIWFKSADRPDLLVAEGLDGLWIDEAARMKPDAWRGNLRMRISDKNGWCILSSTPKGKNWFFTDAYKIGLKDSDCYDPEWESFNFKTADNTAIPGLVEEVRKAKATLPKAYFKREYEASFENFFGQIYEELDESTHIYDKLPEGVRIRKYVGGMDFGWRQGALVILGQDQFGCWYVLEEKVEGHLYTVADAGVRSWASEIADILDSYPEMTIWCDSADPEAIKLLRRAGVPTRKAHKEVLRGIELVAMYSHVRRDLTTKLRISKKCPKTWDQLNDYIWDDYSGVLLDRPAPNQEDHIPDALRYALYSDFVRGKQDVQRCVVGF